jgi:hypothetical protein
MSSNRLTLTPAREIRRTAKLFPSHDAHLSLWITCASLRAVDILLPKKMKKINAGEPKKTLFLLYLGLL